MGLPPAAKPDVNVIIRKVIPEFAETKYGAYPMNESAWLSPAAKVPGSGQPGFIRHQDKSTATLKQDYVWGPGTRAFGYYHLLTQEAYVILAARLQSMSAATKGCGCFGGGSDDPSKGTPDEIKKVQLIMYARSKSPVPKDAYASEFAVQEAGAAFRPPDDIGAWELRGDKVKA
mmetsp:Transcript_27218/g.39870  ORF Transcript_27218/g.39870 Transcript_27218/m.39870 type:complete len:174 (-) Transcript_27218:247-768(-)|eukprot:CAMPEP_0194047116 /NCGR_PEP_ID=MMETSP0009_2-20130614/23565_1 /TAXON_ID=210454 /ORGANISM="Grammatophora oceanica, Strain CCMP 410" /LENGTH=173 /DNA_ID=CAMNT_0038692635 /DNA_START=96 /DNA_END=617 /DNA_ORIENTATION=-